MSERECRTFEKSLPILRHRHCWASSVPVWCPCPERNLTFRRMRQRLMHRQSAGDCRCRSCAAVRSGSWYCCIARSCCKTAGTAGNPAFLLRYGYTADMDLAACLMRLQNRIAEKPEFPHEIGIFLGYPLEDVDGFITHQGENCKLCGCWKVYGNVEQARRTFASYEKCRVFLCAKLSKGCNILQALKIS